MAGSGWTVLVVALCAGLGTLHWTVGESEGE